MVILPKNMIKEVNIINLDLNTNVRLINNDGNYYTVPLYKAPSAQEHSINIKHVIEYAEQDDIEKNGIYLYLVNSVEDNKVGIITTLQKNKIEIFDIKPKDK